MSGCGMLLRRLHVRLRPQQRLRGGTGGSGGELEIVSGTGEGGVQGGGGVGVGGGDGGVGGGEGGGGADVIGHQEQHIGEVGSVDRADGASKFRAFKRRGESGGRSDAE